MASYVVCMVVTIFNNNNVKCIFSVINSLFSLLIILACFSCCRIISSLVYTVLSVSVYLRTWLINYYRYTSTLDSLINYINYTAIDVRNQSLNVSQSDDCVLIYLLRSISFPIYLSLGLFIAWQ